MYSNHNLLKQGYSLFLNGTEEKRLIDTNELAAKRLDELAAAAVSAQAQDGDFAEGFVQGIDAVDVSALLGGADENAVVLKAESAPERARGILEDANARAQELLGGANAQAHQIMEDAKGQAEDLKRAAIEEGRMSGYREGKSKADAEAEGLRRQLKAKEAKLEADYQSALDQMESQLVEAITGVYERIFHVELGSYRGILLYLIASTLRRAEGEKDILVHVSRDDYPYVSAQKQKLREVMAGNGISLEVVEDTALEKNACMIETEGGIFDCGLGTQLAQLRRRLRLLSYTG